MSVNSAIEWTMHTWNPTTGCDKVSQGCKLCYAEVMHRRLMKMHPKKYNKPFLGNVVTHPEDLTFPGTIKKPGVFFVNSMSDLFHKDVPEDFINAVFQVMRSHERHTFQILTKRADIAANFYRRNAKWHWMKNVWIGTSVEDQKTANERIPHLLQVPAVVRFLSCEPLLGPVDLSICTTWPPHKCQECGFVGRGLLVEEGTECPECEHFMDRLPMIDWVIAGGESGHGARPMHPDWVRAIRDQCKAAGVPFFFKQWGQWGAYDKAVRILKPDEPLEIFHHTHVYRDGKVDNNPPYQDVDNNKCEWVFKLGKHQSGNELDGVTHTEMPKTV